MELFHHGYNDEVSRNTQSKAQQTENLVRLDELIAQNKTKVEFQKKNYLVTVSPKSYLCCSNCTLAPQPCLTHSGRHNLKGYWRVSAGVWFSVFASALRAFYPCSFTKTLWKNIPSFILTLSINIMISWTLLFCQIPTDNVITIWELNFIRKCILTLISY